MANTGDLFVILCMLMNSDLYKSGLLDTFK